MATQAPADGGSRAGLAPLLTKGSPLMRVADAFTAAGAQIYLVGGAVRDALLGREQKGELDLATDLAPERTLEVLRPLARSVWLQGIAFGTVGANVDGVDVEVTTFRSDRYEAGSRHPEVSYDGATIESDLSRRDFTVNAIAVRLPDRAAVDVFGGVEDLRRKVLKTPIDPKLSFTDDPLRILRAFRFVSQLGEGFTIEEATLSAIGELKEHLRHISAERIRDELSKLLTGAAPRRALELADRAGVTDVFLPELGALKLSQDPVHRHKDVFAHTLAVMERTPPVLELRLAALLHDIGKPKTRRIGPEGVSFHHHEVEGAKMARARLRELRFPNDVVDEVYDLIFLHHRFHTYGLGWTDSAVRRYVRDAGPRLGNLNQLVRADCTTRNPNKARRLQARMDDLESRIAELAQKEELDKMRPDLDGEQIMAFLGVGPGPVVGKARRFLLELRIDEGPLGEEEAYARLEGWARLNGIERPEDGR